MDKEDKLEEVEEIEFWRAKYLSKRNMVIVSSVLCFILGVVIVLTLFRLGIIAVK
jgi:hypothetical protein